MALETNRFDSEPMVGRLCRELPFRHPYAGV